MVKRVMIGVDPEFVDLLRKVKKDFDLASDRRASKEIVRMLENKKKRFIL